MPKTSTKPCRECQVPILHAKGCKPTCRECRRKRLGVEVGAAKVCRKCGQKSDHYYADSRNFDGLQSICAKCSTIKSAAQYRAHRYRRKMYNRERNSGLTAAQIEQMLRDQDGLCLICDSRIELDGRGANSAVIDHRHDTGEIRGILCSHCNRGLGLFREDMCALHRAIEYIAGTRLHLVNRNVG